MSNEHTTARTAPSPSAADELWNLLTQAASRKRGSKSPVARTANAKRRLRKEQAKRTRAEALARERERLGLLPPGKARPSPESFRPLELILPVHEWTCLSCGAKGTAPNHLVLLRQASKRDPSLIWARPLEAFELSAYAHLPRRIEYTAPRSIPVCDRCFDLDATIEGARTFAFAQLSLPFPSEKGDLK